MRTGMLDGPWERPLVACGIASRGWAARGGATTTGMDVDSRKRGTLGSEAEAVVTILSTAHDVADARLHRLVNALLAAGMTVHVEALGEQGGAPSGASARLRPRGGLFARFLSASVLPLRVSTPVLVVLDPELTWPALVWRAVRRGRVVMDVHEDYTALLHDRAWAHGAAGVLAGGLARASVAATRRADLTVVADDHVPPITARRRLVVPNLPRASELPMAGMREPTPRAIYIGDVRTSRGLDRMVQAVLVAPPWELDIVGAISPSERHRVATEVGGQADRIRFHGRLPFQEAWRLAEGAWAGLALLDDTPAFGKAVPTKVYEYMGSGLAVMVTDLPRMAEMVNSAGSGTVVGSVDEAAATLRRWQREPALLEEHRAAARRWAEQHLAGPSPFDEFARMVSALVADHSRAREQRRRPHRRQR